MYRSVSQCSDPAKSEEGKGIVSELARLKYEVQHDRHLTLVFCSVAADKYELTRHDYQTRARRWVLGCGCLQRGAAGPRPSQLAPCVMAVLRVLSVQVWLLAQLHSPSLILGEGRWHPIG